MTKAYENLANAVVVQAVADYRGVLRTLAHYPDDRDALSICHGLEAFFRSGWFSVLTNLDGRILMRRIQSESGAAEVVA